MKFWDSSALLPLILPETQSSQALKLVKSDPDLLVWTLTTVECCSAIYRKHREGKIKVQEVAQYLKSLRKLEKSWNEIIEVNLVKARAERILGSHRLRAADSMQLAAALIACEERTHEIEFVTFDHLLAEAAMKEGFQVII